MSTHAREEVTIRAHSHETTRYRPLTATATNTASAEPQPILPAIRARLFGARDPVEAQLRDIARQGTGLARLAHACAAVMIVLFSAGSLIALGADSMQSVLSDWQRSGTINWPNAISLAVIVLLVMCMDTGMLYAATILRVMNARHAEMREKLLHICVMVFVAFAEAATYEDMTARFEHPHGLVVWGLVTLRAVSAPFLAVYLAMARALPVGPKDILYQAELASGYAVVRDVVTAANDPAADLDDNMRVYNGAALMSAQDRARLEGMITAMREIVERREAKTAEQAMRSDPTPPPTPEPPLPPTPPQPETTQDDDDRSNVRILTPLPDKNTAARRAVRADAGRPTVARAQLRAKREEAAFAILGERPDIGPRELARRVALATKNRCSESTAHELLRTIQGKARLARTIEEARAAYDVAEA